MQLNARVAIPVYARVTVFERVLLGSAMRVRCQNSDVLKSARDMIWPKRNESKQSERPVPAINLSMLQLRVLLDLRPPRGISVSVTAAERGEVKGYLTESQTIMGKGCIFTVSIVSSMIRSFVIK